MEPERIRARLLNLANERLKNYPLELDTLRAEVAPSIDILRSDYWEMKLSAVSLNQSIAAASGRADANDAQLLRLIDDWHARQSRTTIAALPLPQQPIQGSASSQYDATLTDPPGIGRDSMPRSRRANLLTPIIKAAQRDCENRFDTAEVWLKLTGMATKKVRPLIGITEEGIQWDDGTQDETKYLTKEALGARLKRQQKE